MNRRAFTIQDDAVRALSLNAPPRASVLIIDGVMLETSIDNIELCIVSDYLLRNKP